MDALSRQPTHSSGNLGGGGFRRETSKNIVAAVWAQASELGVTSARSSLLVMQVKRLWCQEEGGRKGVRARYLGDGVT